MQFIKKNSAAQSVPVMPLEKTGAQQSVVSQEPQKPTDERIKQLQLELQERDKTIEEYTAHLKRLQADFENYMKRTNKEKLELQTLSAGRIVTKILTTLDDFERALTNTGSLEEFKQGIRMVFDQLKKTLSEEGLVEIPSTGTLDPYKHEVMLQQPSTQPEGSILATLQKGYTFKNNLLRCAKVSIATSILESKAPNKETNTAASRTETSEEEHNGKGKNNWN